MMPAYIFIFTYHELWSKASLHFEGDENGYN